jgi:hypothetical protein
MYLEHQVKPRNARLPRPVRQPIFPLQGGHALWKSGKPGKLREFDNSGKIREMSGNFCCAQGILTVSLVCYAAILQ